MPLSPPSQDMIFRSNLIWLIVAQAFCILPLLIRLPVWIWGVWLFAILWRIQIHRARWCFPSFWLKLVLGLGSALGIYLTYQGVVGVEPMIGFLVCSFILKIIEMRTKKDALIVLFIGFIAVAAQFLFAQGVLAGVYGLFSLFILLAAWQAAFVSRKLSVKIHLQRGIMLLGQSVPFMMILFIVMPRVGPLWSVPLPQGQGKTGFSETLRLGDIGELVKSPAVAFRASFKSPAPAVEEMYWRGLALDSFDGHTWSASERASDGGPWVQSNAEADFEYSVIMEPHQYHWLFTLGVPIGAESSQLKLQKNHQNLLSSRTPVAVKAQYSVRSNRLDYHSANALDESEKRQLTALPSGGNSETRELAARWRAQQLPADVVVNEALAFYRRGFSYTLQPPPLGMDPIDGFLFDTKQGFCEHFASSFVFLMRAAGIPARIMVGYLGGELNGAVNALESYYIVRQSDAHAWVEVWLDGRGWQTVDPTAVVAPSRAAFGLEDALSEEEKYLVGARDWQSRAFTKLYQHMDALEYSWNRWVLNYDSDRQRGLLERLLGTNSPWRVGAAFAILCILIFLAVAILHFVSKQSRERTVEYAMIYPVLQKLKRRGVERQPNETLGQFAARLSASHPALAESMAKVHYWYTQAAYADDPRALEQLRGQIKRMDIGSIRQ